MYHRGSRRRRSHPRPSGRAEVPACHQHAGSAGGCDRRHNEGSTIQRRMRLRLAFHAGEIHQDAHGVAGAAINHAFRLIEAPALKSALDTSPGVLAVIVSGWFFDEVVRHHPAAAPGVYRQVQVTVVKETDTVAWIRVADDRAARTHDPSPAAVERASAAGSTEVASAAEVHTGHGLHERADGPVALSVTVPLGRLPVEVRGRDSLLAELRASVTTRRLLRRHQAGVVWVLAGMGGLGKSTAALATAEVAVAGAGGRGGSPLLTRLRCRDAWWRCYGNSGRPNLFSGLCGRGRRSQLTGRGNS